MTCDSIAFVASEPTKPPDEVLWPLTISELEPDLAEQSREQYLRCVLAICNDPAEGGASRPEKALAAVDVLCVLFEE